MEGAFFMNKKSFRPSFFSYLFSMIIIVDMHLLVRRALVNCVLLGQPHFGAAAHFGPHWAAGEEGVAPSPREQPLPKGPAVRSPRHAAPEGQKF